jgi:DNA-binding MarR family transcriptional regulator
MDIESEYLSEPGPVGLFRRLTRVGLLVEAFQSDCLEPFGLRFIDYSVLRVLQLAGAPPAMSPTELADVVVRSSGGMTQILDRLERAALVRRAPDPSDRRKVLVTLTDTGLATAKRAHGGYLEAREQLLESLSPPEIDELDASVRRLLDLLGRP